MIDALLANLNESYDERDKLLQKISDMIDQAILDRYREKQLLDRMIETEKLLKESSSFAARKSLELDDLKLAIREPGRN